MAGLGRPQNVPGASDLHVPHGDSEALAEARMLLNYCKTLCSVLSHESLRRSKQKRVSAQVGSSHATPELIQIGQAESVRSLDYDCVGAGYVQTGFNNVRANQHVEFPRHEVQHHLLELAVGHLPVGYPKSRLRNQSLKSSSPLPYGLNPVVQVKDLSPTAELAQYSLSHRLFRLPHHVGSYGTPVRRGRFYDGEISNSGQREIESSGNWGRSQGENVNMGLVFLDLLFVRYTEAMLFIYDQQPQIVKRNVLTQKFVSADYQVDLAFP